MLGSRTSHNQALPVDLSNAFSWDKADADESREMGLAADRDRGLAKGVATPNSGRDWGSSSYTSVGAIEAAGLSA